MLSIECSFIRGGEGRGRGRGKGREGRSTTIKSFVVLIR